MTYWLRKTRSNDSDHRSMDVIAWFVHLNLIPVGNSSETQNTSMSLHLKFCEPNFRGTCLIQKMFKHHLKQRKTTEKEFVHFVFALPSFQFLCFHLKMLKLLWKTNKKENGGTTLFSSFFSLELTIFQAWEVVVASAQRRQYQQPNDNNCGVSFSPDFALFLGKVLRRYLCSSFLWSVYLSEYPFLFSGTRNKGSRILKICDCCFYHL